MALTVKKKPGRDRCVAKFGIRQKGALRFPQEVTSKSRRPKTMLVAWVFDVPDRVSFLKGRVGVKTNGGCVWRLKLWGPRKGEP